MASDWFRSVPDKGRHEGFLRDVCDLLLEALFSSTQRGSPVVRWTEPQHLAQILAKHGLREEPSSHDQLLHAIRDTVKHSVSTGHPYFINQLFSSVDPYGLAGQWVTDTLNASVYTYEVAPVFTLMEEEVVRHMRHLAGFKQGDGIFCPGGSMANGLAMNLARYRHCPEVKAQGSSALPRLVALTSQDAHYSLHKMAALLGIGEDNVRLVATDAQGRMDPAALEDMIRSCLDAGDVPFMVSATAGTTVLGAVDPLLSVSEVCVKHKLWLHVDAAWGGGLLFSRTHRHKLHGLERADSVTWNPHKLLGVPQQCSVLLVHHEGLLESCHSRNASYLFQKDKFYDTSYDTGDKHVQCGRRPDVFKFWLMWKAKGTLGLERHVDSLMECSAYLTARIRDHPSFRLVMEPEFINVCFWFLPERLRGREIDPAYNQLLHKVAPKIKERMMRKGSLMIGYQPLHKNPNFFRFVIQNSGITKQDVDYVLDEIESLGKDL